MNLQSPKVSIDKSPKAIFNYINNVKNFEQLMPENISKFEIKDENTFLFALKGMPEIMLKKKETEPYSTINFGAGGGKLDFVLSTKITEESPEKSLVQLTFEGDFNPMMAMMIKGPIGKFIETLVTNLQKVSASI